MDPVIVDVTEQKRLNEAREKGIPWKKWGPYLSERQWGTVREDYAKMAMPGTISAMTRRARGLTVGAKMGSAEFVMTSNGCALP